MGARQEFECGSITCVVDGDVLELFGTANGSKRFLVRRLELTLSDPDKKGRRSLLLRDSGGNDSGSQLTFDAEQAAGAQGLADALTAGGARPA